MEPIVITAALGGLLANALSGIVGNRADVAVNTSWQAIVDRLKKGDKLVNHDLQRAVLRSFALALKTICKDCINDLKAKKKENAEDIRWLEQKRRSLDEELKSIEKAEDVEPSLESLEEIELLVLPNGSLAQDRLNTVRAKLIDAATRDGEPPKFYKEKVEKELFELMSLFFSNEIRENQRVSNIFEGRLLAQIDVRLQGQQLTVERIEASLRDVRQAVPQVDEKLTAIMRAANQQTALEKSLALRLGYLVAAIERLSLDVQDGVREGGFQVQDIRRAYVIAKDLGLSVSTDSNIFVRDVLLQLESKPYVVKTAFRIGNIIGRLYFQGIFFIAYGIIRIDDPRNEILIREVEQNTMELKQLLIEVELPSDFLKPFMQLYQDTLIGKKMTVEAMGHVIDQLCKSIEASS